MADPNDPARFDRQRWEAALDAVTDRGNFDELVALIRRGLWPPVELRERLADVIENRQAHDDIASAPQKQPGLFSSSTRRRIFDAYKRAIASGERSAGKRFLIPASEALGCSREALSNLIKNMRRQERKEERKREEMRTGIEKRMREARKRNEARRREEEKKRA